MTAQTAIILAIGLIAAALVAMGRFTVVPVSNSGAAGYVIIMDRFTGDARFCVPAGCRDVGELRQPGN